MNEQERLQYALEDKRLMERILRSIEPRLHPMYPKYKNVNRKRVHREFDPVDQISIEEEINERYY